MGRHRGRISDSNAIPKETENCFQSGPGLPAAGAAREPADRRFGPFPNSVRREWRRERSAGRPVNRPKHSRSSCGGRIAAMEIRARTRVESCRADHVSTVGEQTRTCTRQKGCVDLQDQPIFLLFFALIIMPIVVVKLLAWMAAHHSELPIDTALAGTFRSLPFDRLDGMRCAAHLDGAHERRRREMPSLTCIPR